MGFLGFLFLLSRGVVGRGFLLVAGFLGPGVFWPGFVRLGVVVGRGVFWSGCFWSRGVLVAELLGSL